MTCNNMSDYSIMIIVWMKKWITEKRQSIFLGKLSEVVIFFGVVTAFTVRVVTVEVIFFGGRRLLFIITVMAVFESGIVFRFTVAHHQHLLYDVYYAPCTGKYTLSKFAKANFVLNFDEFKGFALKNPTRGVAP
ncbi:MAG: hypothetical protein IJU14_00800 [Clostridia bacterium]|nr:hypothetical protein [Clostridia bacterium]